MRRWDTRSWWDISGIVSCTAQWWSWCSMIEWPGEDFREQAVASLFCDLLFACLHRSQMVMVIIKHLAGILPNLPVRFHTSIHLCPMMRSSMPPGWPGWLIGETASRRRWRRQGNADDLAAGKNHHLMHHKIMLLFSIGILHTDTVYIRHVWSFSLSHSVSRTTYLSSRLNLTKL